MVVSKSFCPVQWLRKVVFNWLFNNNTVEVYRLCFGKCWLTFRSHGSKEAGPSPFYGVPSTIRRRHPKCQELSTSGPYPFTPNFPFWHVSSTLGAKNLNLISRVKWSRTLAQLVGQLHSLDSLFNKDKALDKFPKQTFPAGSCDMKNRLDFKTWSSIPVKEIADFTIDYNYIFLFCKKLDSIIEVNGFNQYNLHVVTDCVSLWDGWGFYTWTQTSLRLHFLQ